jgi:hypothetical protein
MVTLLHAGARLSNQVRLLLWMLRRMPIVTTTRGLTRHHVVGSHRVWVAEPDANWERETSLGSKGFKCAPNWEPDVAACDPR